MLKPNEWSFWVKAEEIPDNGVFAFSVSDDVLDKDCWPVWTAVMVNCIVESWMPMYTSDVYDIPDMTGWTKEKVAEWAQYEPGNSHPQISHDMCWLAPTPKEDYWVCASIRTDVERKLVLSIMSYYHVRGYVMGDGDVGEVMVIDQETQPGELQLAEMAFHGCGMVVWDQANVCPICKDQGEDFCGHMYFNKARKAAF